MGRYVISDTSRLDGQNTTNVVEYTNPGTYNFVVPANVRRIWVTAIGGGGMGRVTQQQSVHALNYSVASYNMRYYTWDSYSNLGYLGFGEGGHLSRPLIIRATMGRSGPANTPGEGYGTILLNTTDNGNTLENYLNNTYMGVASANDHRTQMIQIGPKIYPGPVVTGGPLAANTSKYPFKSFNTTTRLMNYGPEVDETVSNSNPMVKDVTTNDIYFLTMPTGTSVKVYRLQENGTLTNATISVVSGPTISSYFVYANNGKVWVSLGSSGIPSNAKILFYSSNFGASFTPTSLNLATEFPGGTPTFAVNPIAHENVSSDGTVVYTSVMRNDSDQAHKVYRSTNSGVTLTNIATASIGTASGEPFHNAGSHSIATNTDGSRVVMTTYNTTTGNWCIRIYNSSGTRLAEKMIGAYTGFLKTPNNEIQTFGELTFQHKIDFDNNTFYVIPGAYSMNVSMINNIKNGIFIQQSSTSSTTTKVIDELSGFGDTSVVTTLNQTLTVNGGKPLHTTNPASEVISSNTQGLSPNPELFKFNSSNKFIYPGMGPSFIHNGRSDTSIAATFSPGLPMLYYFSELKVIVGSLTAGYVSGVPGASNGLYAGYSVLANMSTLPSNANDLFATGADMTYRYPMDVAPGETVTVKVAQAKAHGNKGYVRIDY